MKLHILGLLIATLALGCGQSVTEENEKLRLEIEDLKADKAESQLQIEELRRESGSQQFISNLEQSRLRHQAYTQERLRMDAEQREAQLQRERNQADYERRRLENERLSDSLRGF